MKIAAVIAIAALVMLSACDRQSSTETASYARPVDAWMPFVQVLPPQGIWDVRPSEMVFYYAYETYGELIWTRFRTEQPQLVNELDSITISARMEYSLDSRGNRVQNAFEFVFSVYNNSENSYQVLYSYLSVFRNARWVYFRTNTNLINTEFTPGYNHSRFPRRFTRQHSGPFRITFVLRRPGEQEILHRLEHIFQWVE